MKKIIASLLFFFAACGCAVASMTFSSDSKSVVVSTTPASPTQLLTSTSGSFVQNTSIFQNTGFYLYVSTSNVTISTGTAASPAVGASWNPYIPSGSTLFNMNGFFPQDMNGGAYQGPLWGVLASTSTNGATAATPQPVSVLRFK